jgi:putative ABC transport system ATP-binding protein
MLLAKQLITTFERCAMIEKNDILIETINLTKIYGESTKVCALEGINLQVKHSEFVAITGPSGSGKSTLLNLLGTLDSPTSGQVWIGGVDVSKLRDNALADFRRAHIGFIFQLFNLVPSLTARENVMLPLLPYRQQGHDLKARSEELLDLVGLASRMKHLPSQLSGGEQQRVAIARALINEPDLILADEPTGNLDSQAGAEIVGLLRQMNREQGVTVVLATHDQTIANQADQLVRLTDGQIHPT